MSPLSPSTTNLSPDPIDDLVYTPPGDGSSLPPSNQQEQQQRAQQQLSPLTRTVPNEGQPIKLERPSQTAVVPAEGAVDGEAGEEEHDEDAQDSFVQSHSEEREVERAVASDDRIGGEGETASDTEGEHPANQQSSTQEPKGKASRDEWGSLKPDWGEEHLEDEMRPLDMTTMFAEPLLEYQARQDDVIQDYMRGMFATMLRSEVWATTYLRKQSEAHAQQLDEAMGRIAEEETYQESMRQNLLRVKKQVQDAMEHLAGMQSLALVRVHQRSESAEPRSTSGRKKARTQ